MFDKVKERLNSFVVWMKGIGKKIAILAIALLLIFFAVFLFRGCTKNQQLSRKSFYANTVGLDRKIVFDGPSEKRVWLVEGAKIKMEPSCIRFMDENRNVILIGYGWYVEEVDNLKELKANQ